MDPFVLYGGTYKKLRESMSGAMYGNQIEELAESTRVLSLFNTPLYVVVKSYILYRAQNLKSWSYSCWHFTKKRLLVGLVLNLLRGLVLM